MRSLWKGRLIPKGVATLGLRTTALEKNHGSGLNSAHTEFIELEPWSVTLFEIRTLLGS